MIKGGCMLPRSEKITKVMFCVALVFLCPLRQALSDEDSVETNAQEQAVGAEHDERKDAYENIQLLTEVLMQVRSNYVEEKTYEEIINGAIEGMLNSLDPYSSFLDTTSYKAMREETTGQFGGIGIHIGMRHGLLTVIAPIEDTPAFKAGLHSGDIIHKIEDEKTYGLSLKDAVDKLRGPRGEPVNITILRSGEEDPIEVDLVRDDIVVPSVKGARMMDDDIGYLRIIQFSRPTAGDLHDELDKLMEQGMKALVMDLRSNPGGLLAAAIDVSSMFLKKNTLVVSTKGRRGIYNRREKSHGKLHYTGFPMAIMVNEGSASASEIVAGALQANKRAIIVGSQTFGKGSVQSIRPLLSNTNTAVRMTTAYYYTPDGRQIHGEGIKPDIDVKIPRSEWRDVIIRRSHIENPHVYNDEEKGKYTDVVDRQLQRASDILKGLLIFE